MTIPVDAIQNMADMLYRKGSACDFGIDESQLQSVIDLVFARYPSKGVSAVKDWKWWDFEVSQEVRTRYEAVGIQPAILFADYLIWDSRGRWSEGWNVKTTPLVVFEENCLFITRNTVYILVGSGHRKMVDPQLAAALHF